MDSCTIHECNTHQPYLQCDHYSNRNSRDCSGGRVRTLLQWRSSKLCSDIQCWQQCVEDRLGRDEFIIIHANNKVFHDIRSFSGNNFPVHITDHTQTSFDDSFIIAGGLPTQNNFTIHHTAIYRWNLPLWAKSIPYPIKSNLTYDDLLLRIISATW